MSAPEYFTICITTKSRAQDLGFTLTRLISFGLDSVPIIIIDDGSPKDEFCDPVILKRFKNLHLIRNDVSKGLIVNRNTMAKIAKTEFIISLDDDSCFDSPPNFEYLRQVFARWPDAVGLQLNNYEIKFGELPRSTDTPEQPVQMYTGFGHVLRRGRFLEIGGYLEDLVHMAEEREFAQRAWIKGFKVIFAPGVAVEHRRTPVARSTKRNVYFLARNTLIFNGRNLPCYLAFIKFSLIIPYFFWKFRGEPSCYFDIVKGVLHGVIWVCRNVKAVDERMTIAEYRRYSSLPQMRP